MVCRPVRGLGLGVAFWPGSPLPNSHVRKDFSAGVQGEQLSRSSKASSPAPSYTGPSRRLCWVGPQNGGSRQRPEVGDAAGSLLHHSQGAAGQTIVFGSVCLTSTSRVPHCRPSRTSCSDSLLGTSSRLSLGLTTGASSGAFSRQLLRRAWV